jgi:hypothetical protein
MLGQGDAFAAAPPAIVAAPNSDQLFAKIYPVFTHPRCANCHGVVQHYPGVIYSVTAETHPGGEVRDYPDRPPEAISCVTAGCHDAPEVEKAWKATAPPDMEWAGMNEEQLCALEAAQVRLKNRAAGGAGREGSYLYHLGSDPLVLQSFGGRAGGARQENPDLPTPPLKYQEFIAGAADWVSAGAPCRATGTIAQHEENDSAYEHPTPGGKIAVEQHGRRDVNVVRHADGSATATIVASGSSQIVSTTFADGCVIITTQRDSWKRIGPPQVPARFDVQVRPGDYTIHFVLPADTTQELQTITETNTCGASNLVVPASTVELTWKPWSFTIHCPTEFPNTDGSLGCIPTEPHDTGAATGIMHVTVIGASDASEPRSWLYRSPMPTARTDTGEGLPVHVKTIYAMRVDRK